LAFSAYIGTSGYSYGDWKGVFYPEDLKSTEFLSWYAQKFNFSELNFSYYSMPKETNLSKMAQSVPEGFRFSIKAHKSLTHEKSDHWTEDLAAFLGACDGLGDKLLSVLFQFPFSFHYTPENRRYLDTLCRHLEGHPADIEFRNAEWAGDSVVKGLTELGCGLVLPDLPELPGLPKKNSPFTGTRTYLRFHGRNSIAWWTGTNVTRYDYLYSEEELLGFQPIVARCIEEKKILAVAFNNHYKGQAVQNAQMFQKLIQKALPETGIR
jgi:uncharacterized protein YecE (DUF72 family)